VGAGARRGARPPARLVAPAAATPAAPPAGALVIVGTGIDLVEVERVRALLDGRGERALRRLFTDVEIAYAAARAEPWPHYAARVAAKEAAFKALAGTIGARAIGWRELEVVNGWDGRPTLELHGRAAERAAELGVTAIHLSLTHTRAMAAAFVVLESAASL
jgi:holo-[acyl-carrier protein] synthase